MFPYERQIGRSQTSERTPRKGEVPERESTRAGRQKEGGRPGPRAHQSLHRPPQFFPSRPRRENELPSHDPRLGTDIGHLPEVSIVKDQVSRQCLEQIGRK